jgi:Uncharacterized alpha/beta hydrolase domain (DUF2235)
MIRHAVGIDERRAKFRQDLISESNKTVRVSRGRVVEKDDAGHLKMPEKTVKVKQTEPSASERYRRKSHAHQHALRQYRDASPARSTNQISEQETDAPSLHTASSNPSLRPVRRATGDMDDDDGDDDDADEALPQDIDEVWFPGCHAVS